MELIISSGGTKGYAIIGALNTLIKHYPIEKFQYITGCSIGAIIGLMLMIGYTIDELNNILMQLKFEMFQDLKIINFIEKNGLDDGSRMTNLFKAILLNKKIDPSITFKELYEKTNKIITITVVNITKGVTEYHNYYTQPDMEVLLSLRMSSNIPIVFSPILYNNHYYVDGALLDPYPYFFIKNTKKIGIWLFEKYEFHFIKNTEVEFVNSMNDNFSYIMNLLKIIHINYMKKYYKKILKNTVYIDFDYSSITFEVSDVDKKNMFLIGSKKCNQFMKKIYKTKRKKYLAFKYFYLWYSKIKKNSV
jgi:predicted acylesterase/phospholipase RssA